MNVPSLIALLGTVPLLSAVLLCVASWAAAWVCFSCGLMNVMRHDSSGNLLRDDDNSNLTASYSTTWRALQARDESAARLGWLWIVLAMFMRGVCALLALSQSLSARLLFVFLIIAVPVMCGMGLFHLLSPCLTRDEVNTVQSAEEENSEEETAAFTAKNTVQDDAPRSLPLAHILDDMAPRMRNLTLMAFDAVILGCSLAALSWWLCGRSNAPAVFTRFDVLLCSVRDFATACWFVSAAWVALSFPSLSQTRLGLSLSLSLSLSPNKNSHSERQGALAAPYTDWQKTLQRVWTAVLCGSLVFGAASAHLNNLLPSANTSGNSIPLFDTLLLTCGTFCYGAAAWFLVSDETTSPVEDDSVVEVNTRETASGTPMMEAAFLVARNFLTLLLPCAAAAAGTWYAMHANAEFPGVQVHSHGLAGAEVWWNAALLLGASLRHLSLNLYENLYSSRQSESLQRTVGALREEVAWRTRQLTTLHSVSADLNNTLSHEQVLNLALQRLMEAVRADAGAVWLLSNFEQIAAHKTDQSRGAGQNGLESKRTKNERKNDDNATAASSSTRLAGQKANNRVNLLEVFDAEQKKARSQHEETHPKNDETKIVHQAAAFSTGKKRLSAAVESFHSLQALENVKTTRPIVATNGLLAAREISAPDKNNGADNKATPVSAPKVVDSGIANASLASTADVSGHGLRRTRALPNGFQNEDAQHVEAESNRESANALADLDEDGVYVSGPLGSWGTFVASSPAAPDESVASQPVLHLISHTRDTYGTPDRHDVNADTTSDTSADTTVDTSADMVVDAPRSETLVVNGAMKNGTEENIEKEEASSNGVLDASGFVHRNWRLVRASGYNTPDTNRTLEAMNRALEEGGIVKCARLSASWFGTIGDVHLAPIRWHGEIVGVLSVTSRKRHFQNADRRLLEALASELSGALRNSYIYQEARRWAERDSVTNLFNHRAMQEKLGQELIHARNTGTEVTVVMMDLNNFKFFNDTYGHPVGDRVLVTVAQCLRESCRTSDILGRYGGDEFIAVLPNTSTAEALEICRRIEECVEEQPFSEGGDEERRIPIGLSFGAAVYPHDGKSSLELLTVADAHLYDAKRGGSPLAQLKDTEDTQELRKLKDMTVGGSFGVLDALVTAIDNKDNYTRRHSEDVMHWAVLMGRELGYSEDELRAVRICGLLHDVGKIAVPDAILRKPGRLDDDEFAILQQHPVFGALIVKDVPNLPEVLGGIRHHHERFDGQGYPDKLAGEEIPQMGRLLAVPDCFSAMTTNRPYRKALTWDEALSEIERGSGTQFDPQMSIAFLGVMSRIINEQNQKIANDKIPLAQRKAARPDLEAPAFPSSYAS